MIVYGDPQFRTTLQNALDLLDSTARHIQSNQIESIRTLLIQAGQLEQALADVGNAGSCENLTDCIADAFVDLWSGRPSSPPLASRVAAFLERARKLPEAELTVKVPEGFEFYAVYPEQYAAAALKWTKENPPPNAGKIVVVGIRSIGTTLSAVVAATLRTCGHSTRRMTVRPTGHPYQRHVNVAAKDITGASRALIVDEGPGLSGSSMAATAGALDSAGIPRRQIAFFPGNLRMPQNRFLKTDCFGHVHNHTIVGSQDILWDVAGVGRVTDRRAKRPTASHGIEREGLELAHAALPFYQLAYAAFRLGMMEMCAQSQPGGSAEHRRLLAARDSYATALKRLLSRL